LRLAAIPNASQVRPNRLFQSGRLGNGHHNDATKPAIETAFEKIESIKGSYREAIRGLNDLTDTLKQVQREQKTTDKEVASVRTTLEKLQSVRI
jgi:phage shock protein A